MLIASLRTSRRFIREIQSSGVASHRAIARSLNARGIATARGGEWTAVQVGAIMKRCEARIDLTRSFWGMRPRE
jgi:hypothetical protein